MHFPNNKGSPDEIGIDINVVFKILCHKMSHHLKDLYNDSMNKYFSNKQCTMYTCMGERFIQDARQTNVFNVTVQKVNLHGFRFYIVAKSTWN